MTGPLPIGVVNILAATALLLLAIGLATAVRSGLTRSLAWASIRTFVQLSLLGFVLAWIFKVDTVWVVLAAFTVMLTAAAWTAARRPSRPVPGLMGLTGISLGFGAVATTVVVCVFVIQVDPWWDPRYFLPLGGMILGNSMNAAALAAERLQSELTARRGEIEELLALGASPRQAIDAPLRATFRAAFLPLTNMMLTAGLVSIPGMMNGQIIAGADPTLAARYQIVVMFMISAAVTVSVTILCVMLYRRFFTGAWQLRHELLGD